jgi:hypothetical protein
MASVDLSPTLAGSVITGLYKLPYVFLDVRTANGAVERFRIVPSQISTPFLINALPVDGAELAEIWEGGRVRDPITAVRFTGEGLRYLHRRPVIFATVTGTGITIPDPLTGDMLSAGPEVPNNSFEAGPLSPWVPYSGSSDGEFLPKVECSMGHLGSCALQEMGGSGIVFQDVGGLTPGRRYEITAWARSDRGGSSKAALWVHDTLDANIAMNISGARTPDSEGWERYTVRFLANQTRKVRIHLNYYRGSGAIYWDDVSIFDMQ